MGSYDIKIKNKYESTKEYINRVDKEEIPWFESQNYINLLDIEKI